MSLGVVAGLVALLVLPAAARAQLRAIDYLYVDANTGRLSLVLTHGIDFDTTGLSQPASSVNMDVTGIPPGCVIDVEDDPADANREPLRDNLDRLRASRQPDGTPWRIVTLPMCGYVMADAERLPASYANFYIANGIVLVPTYDPPRDEEALATLRDVFPGRDVVGIDCTDLVWGLGAFHCVTQQWPA